MVAQRQRRRADSPALTGSASRHLAYDCRGLPGRHRDVRRHRLHPALRPGRAQGGTATQAGQVLTPLFLGWVVMSIVGARMTVRLGYRVSAIAGSILMTAGFIGLESLLDSHSPRLLLLVSCTILGAGMGTQMLSLLLAVQHAVDRSQLGLATSLNQFSRSVGAALGVSAMGAILARGLAGTTWLAGSRQRWPPGPLHCPDPCEINLPRRCIAYSLPARWLRRGTAGDDVPSAW